MSIANAPVMDQTRTIQILLEHIEQTKRIAALEQQVSHYEARVTELKDSLFEAQCKWKGAEDSCRLLGEENKELKERISRRKKRTIKKRG